MGLMSVVWRSALSRDGIDKACSAVLLVLVRLPFQRCGYAICYYSVLLFPVRDRIGSAALRGPRNLTRH